MTSSRLFFPIALVIASSTSHAVTFVVDTTSSANGCTAAPGDCGIVAAITAANLQAGADNIHFNIPMSDAGCNAATGVCRITLSSFSGFPSLSTDMTIDGYTQPGAVPNTIPAPGANNAQLKIELTSPVSGVGWLAISSSVSIRGLSLMLPGTQISGFGTPRVNLQGNWFNVSAGGGLPSHDLASSPMDLSGFTNIAIVGGPNPADRNVIAGAGLDSSTPPQRGGGAVSLRANSTASATGILLLQGNLIGLAPDGITPQPLRSAVTISTGDDSFTQPNLRILDNRLVRPIRDFSGAFGGGLALNISRQMTQPMLIQGNVFGVTVDGSAPGIERDAITVSLGNSSQIARVKIGGLATGEGNVFAGTLAQSGGGSLGSAVLMPSGDVVSFVELTGNRNSGNNGLMLDVPHATAGGGITRGRSPIDPGDADVGANRAHNPPEINSFSVSGNQVSLSYRVDSSIANTTYPLRVDFYRALGDEGEVLIGSDDYPASSAGALKSTTLTLPAGVSLNATDVVVALATNADLQSSEASYLPLSLQIQAPVTSDCRSGVPLFCSGFESPPAPSLLIRVRANNSVFAPNGRVRVTGRSANCTLDLTPTTTPLQSEGACVLVGAGAPGNISITAVYDTLSGAFGNPQTGGNVSVTQSFVIAN